MNYLDLYSSYPDHTIAAAWNSQLEYANRNPWLNEALSQCGKELFARFAACYAELRALPRGARRALQRRIGHSSKLATVLPPRLQQGERQQQRRIASSIAGAALLLALGQGVATAATITVTTSNPNIVADGQCSLIEAIVNANNDAATHPDCPAGSGADTIILPANANIILNSVNGFADTDFSLPGTRIGLPEIRSRITIEGNGSTIARQAGAPDFGLISVKGLLPSSVNGDLTLQSVTLSGGSVFGAVQNRGALTIKNSTISGNTGAGVFNNPGTLLVVNSTISGNTKVGLDNIFGRITVQNSTVSGNTDVGIFNYGYGGFYASVLTLTNTVVTGNQGVPASEIINVGSDVYADHFNLFGANGNAGVSGFTPGATDIVPSVPVAQILGPLANNGGPTQTHALVTGSPAIDAGDPEGCRENPPLSGWHGIISGPGGNSGALLLTDQRGLNRQIDGNHDGTVRCDIGAFELGVQEINPAISISDAIVTEGNSGTVTATFQVNLSAPSTQPVTVTFSTANRTANAGTDYVGTSGSLTFDPGETTKTITVVVDGNNTLEFDKTFLVNLTSATNAFIADGQGVATIVNDDGPLPQMLANISTRGGVLTGNNVMIGGFIIDGAAPKRVLIRSRGPSMAGSPFFVPGTLANPMVQLFSGPTLIAQNDNWQDAPNCPGFVCEGATEILNTGLDPCTPNPGQSSSPADCALEAAILITLPPGPYTAIVTGAGNSTGVALVEVFEADASVLSELSNISTRGFVQSEDNVMIGGLIIEGNSPATVLIRARGPSMSGAPFFVPGALANPFLQILSGQNVIAQNDNWQDAPSCSGFVCGTVAQIAATGLDPCQPNPGQTVSPPSCTLESAILITLPPGAYTAIVSGVGGGTGVGLVEAFEMD